MSLPAAPGAAPAGKQAAGDLAVFGGPPLFDGQLHVGRPNIGDRDRLMRRIGDLLDRRWLTNHGPYEREFESRLAEYLGVRHCIAMCNATVALEITARAAGLSGEVIVPSFTFVATAHALQWQEITPVFGDIHPETYTLDPARVEALITPRTTGIVGVHLWGRACDVEALDDVARRHGLRLIFDAAHSFACSYRGTLLGAFGDAEVFSFHATKFLNSFEGGAVATNDDDLAARVRLMKNFGFDGDYDEVRYLGINGKMTEVAAAMGITSLESVEEFVEANRRNHDQYGEGLEGLRGMTLVRYDERERSNYQYVVVEVDENALGLSRDQVVTLLQAENVLARRYFHPGCHRMEPYRTRFPDAGRRLPVTERLAARVIALPTGTSVQPAEVRALCRLLRFAALHAAEIRERWPERRVPPAAVAIPDAALAPAYPLAEEP